jgi:hypothetical protein
VSNGKCDKNADSEDNAKLISERIRKKSKEKKRKEKKEKKRKERKEKKSKEIKITFFSLRRTLMKRY